MTKKTNDNERKILSRAAGRTNARAIIELIESLKPEEMHEQSRIAFWEELREFILEKHHLPNPKTKDVKPYTARQAALFEDELMPFGKFKDQRIGAIPKRYLDWLLGENPKAMEGRIAQYLANEQVTEQLRAELEK